MCTHTQEVSITGQSTSSEDRQQASPADAEGTFRAELLGRLLGAQAELEAQLLALQRDAGTAGLAAECSSQLSALYALQKSISTASPTALAALRAEVVTSTTAAAAMAQQARIGAASAGAISAELAAVSTATRSEVQSLSKDLFERRIFDKHLVFASPNDEAAYRQREAQARRYIDEQHARHTPEGDLNAAGAVVGRMLDAHAHGAGASTEFLPRWNRLVDTTHRQREAMRSEGKSTEEFDCRLAEDVRRFLKAKGVSDAEIDARFAASADPLEAVKPYLKNEKDARTLDVSINRVVQQREQSEPQALTVERAQTTKPETFIQRAEMSTGLDDVMAKLRASGVAASEPTAEIGHGVTAQARPAALTSRTPPG